MWGWLVSHHGGPKTGGTGRLVIGILGAVQVPDPIEPDVKDWTWVLSRPCRECGFDVRDVADVTDVGRMLLDDARSWAVRLDRADARVRRHSTVWSPLEYGCHVRDVHRVFEARVVLMLRQDEPTFANWDQDAAAVAGHYGAQDPVIVADEISAAATAVARTYASVPAAGWGRRGVRSNGSRFTVETIARYHLHDVVHHAHDVDR